MLLLPLVSFQVAFAAPPVTLTVHPGATPSVRVAAVGAPVFLPACRGVVWEAFGHGQETFVPISREPCGPLAPAVPIDAEGLEFALDADPGGAPVVRAVVVVGTGCTAGMPLPLADCASVVAVEGPPITLRKVDEGPSD